MRKLALLILALPFVALAGMKVTEKHEGWQLTNITTGKTTTNDAKDPPWTYADCVNAAKAAGPGQYKCKDSNSLGVTATCDDVPMPVMKTVIDAEGFVVRPGISGEVKDDGTGKVLVVTMEEGFVKGPDWAKGTNCWVPGLVPFDGKFPAPDAPPTGANDMSPSPWVYGVDPEWPIGGKCPSSDPNLCYAPPSPPIPPAAS